MESRRRSEKTKQLLKHTFAKMLRSKRYDEIKIKDLTHIADVSRNTFYVYYSSIYEMIDEIEQEIIRDLCDFHIEKLSPAFLSPYEKTFGESLSGLPAEDLFTFSLHVINYFNNDPAYMRAVILSDNTDPYFHNKIVRQLTKKIHSYLLESENMPNDAITMHIAANLAGTYIAPVINWCLLPKSERIPLKYLVIMINFTKLGGLDAYLKY